MYFIRTLIRIYTPGAGVQGRIRHGLDYNIPMAVLTLSNLAMGLFSWVFTQLIGQGLGMFL
jgi:hypothetical protein